MPQSSFTSQYQQTKKAQLERSNRVPEGEKKSQTDWSTKQARAPGTETAELRVYQPGMTIRPLPARQKREKQKRKSQAGLQ
jgi:uncharacterized protein (DUF58 family)